MGKPLILHDLIFKTTHSLVMQSKYAKKRAEPVNGDGFGIGWYPDFEEPEFKDFEPGLFRSVEPAWNNRNLYYLASKIKSRTFFAHIRDASADLPVSQTNCHPFQFGRFLWMHNGWLEEFHLMKRLIVQHLSDRAYLSIQGNTDSEFAFAMFLDEIAFNDSASESEIESALLRVIDKLTYLRVKAGLATNAQMNFAVSNGEVVFATRFSTLTHFEPNSLFYIQGSIYHAEDGSVKITPKHNALNKILVIASEPLSKTGDNWQSVARNHFIKVSKDSEYTIQPIPSVAD